MKYIDEFRNAQHARRLAERIAARVSRSLRFMEFCGGHTHAILRYGIRQMLPPSVQMLSGPGCPVCVTAARDLDAAIALAQLPGVILTTFGDMLRVPGSYYSLQQAKAEGADVRIVYSTLDALQIAAENRDKAVIFLGVGFETTAPTTAASILQAQAKGLSNYYLLSLHKLTPPAMRAILQAGEAALSGILGPGHVTTIIGAQAWEFLPRDWHLPCAVAGFEPLDILSAIAALVEMAEERRPAVANAYRRSVQAEGNRVAQGMLERVFQVGEADWRGLGRVPASGLDLRDEFAAFDAKRAFPLEATEVVEPRGCRCGEVLRGVLLPTACAFFGQACTPARPVGPCMVSAEGACAAYYLYGEAAA